MNADISTLRASKVYPILVTALFIFGVALNFVPPSKVFTFIWIGFFATSFVTIFVLAKNAKPMDEKANTFISGFTDTAEIMVHLSFFMIFGGLFGFLAILFLSRA